MRSDLRVLLALVVSLVLFAAPDAAALPLYAARTGFACANCHFDPNGGGPRNDFGFAFAKNRHAVEPDTSGAWKDLDLVNRVGDRMPVYFGVNQRFMVLANAATKTDSLDRLGFFNMENALYVVFQPHARLALVYNRDGFDQASITQDAFGMIGGLPLDGYVKAGRFRNPFGLRLDDHTVATRNSFLDFQDGIGFLPYDPRFPDMGIEVGGDAHDFFWRGSWTDGASDVLGIRSSEPYAQTFALKLGHVTRGLGQGALSFYDDVERKGLGPFRRATRWSFYGIGHWRRLAALGEIGAGTDQTLTDGRRNLLAGFAEADWQVSRSVNVRVRYDLLQNDRDRGLVPLPDGSSVSRKDLGTWQRYALEGEFLPVPFAELRWTLRLIDPKADVDAFGRERVTEKQAYLQFHFSY